MHPGGLIAIPVLPDKLVEFEMLADELKYLGVGHLGVREHVCIDVPGLTLDMLGSLASAYGFIEPG